MKETLLSSGEIERHLSNGFCQRLKLFVCTLEAEHKVNVLHRSGNFNYRTFIKLRTQNAKMIQKTLENEVRLQTKSLLNRRVREKN